MGVFMYGDEDHLDCLSYPATTVGLPADQFPGAQMCIGHRYQVHWMGIPYSVSDEGYVLTTDGGKSYISLRPQAIQELQAQGTLPSPMPHYEIPIGWKLAVYGSYALIAVLIIAAIWKSRKKRELRQARATAEITTTGPVLEAKGDHQIDDAIRPHLEPGERVTHQALAYDRKPDSIGASLRGHKHFIALTDRRLLMITTKTGLFGWFQGVPHMRPIDRAKVEGVLAGDEDLTLRVFDAPPLRIVVPVASHGFSAANQRAFLLDVPRLLAQAA